MRQDFTEYNTKYYPLINNTHILMGYPFDHALKKAESYEEAISNLKILGWGDEWKKFVLEAVNHYATFLKLNAPIIEEGAEMELNRVQIEKVLECCASPMQMCKDCPMPEETKDDCRCMETISRNALAYFKAQERKIFDLENRLKECENGYEGTLHLERSKLHDAYEKVNELTVKLKAMRGAANSYKMHNKKLTEENERLSKLSEEGAECPICHGIGKIGTTNWLTRHISAKRLAKEKAKAIAEFDRNLVADTVRKMEYMFMAHFGTYTDKDVVKVKDVFKLLSKYAEEILEGV